MSRTKVFCEVPVRKKLELFFGASVLSRIIDKSPTIAHNALMVQVIPKISTCLFVGVRVALEHSVNGDEDRPTWFANAAPRPDRYKILPE